MNDASHAVTLAASTAPGSADASWVPSTCELAIVGAGPAGLAAARSAAEHGVDVVLLDERNTAGGAMAHAIAPRQQRVPLADEDDARTLMALVHELARVPARLVMGTGVCGIEADDDGFMLVAAMADAVKPLRARRVILATGATERPVPIAGRTLPGVSYVSAAAEALHSTGILPSGRVVLAGSGPLLYLLARDLHRAGANVAALLDTLSVRHFVRALPHAPGFWRSAYLRSGARLLREVNDCVPLHHDVSGFAAHGGERLASVQFAMGKRTETLRADALLLHLGLVPDVQIADTLGCTLAWSRLRCAWQVVADAWGATSVDGVHVAGDAGGVSGMRVAMAQGHLAGLAAAAALGRLDTDARERAAVPHRRALAQALRGRRFMDGVYRPLEALRAPRGDDVVVCRCENVRAGDIIAAILDGAAGVQQVKAYTRCGMGACQGRDCALTVTELVARQRNVAPAAAGRWRARFPARPLTLHQLGSLPSTPAQRAAVERIGAPPPHEAPLPG
jgi:thioredoxin reductase